MILLKL